MDLFDFIYSSLILLLGIVIGAAARPALDVVYRRAFDPCGPEPKSPARPNQSCHAPWPPPKFAQPPNGLTGQIREEKEGGEILVSLRNRD